MAFDDISNFFLSIVYYVKKYDRHIPEHRNKRQKTNNDEMNLHIYENIGIFFSFFICFIFIYLYIEKYNHCGINFFFCKYKHIVFI